MKKTVTVDYAPTDTKITTKCVLCGEPITLPNWATDHLQAIIMSYLVCDRCKKVWKEIIAKKEEQHGIEM